MEEELNEKQKLILKFLKENSEIATTKISFLITSNLYQTQEYLEELEKKGFIESSKKNNATYWSISSNKEGRNGERRGI